MITRLVLLLCCLAMAGVSQDRAAVSGPVSGVVFDENSGTLRPMVGIPGASYLGAPLVSNVEAASVSPDGWAALAVRQGRLVLVTGLTNLAPGIVAIDGAISGADRFAWSRDGNVAAILASGSGSVQVLRDLRKRPAADPAIALGLGGAVSALAADSAGNVVAGVASEANGGVYLLSSGTPRLILNAARPAAIVFANRERDLYVADQARQQIWSVPDFAGGQSPAIFADGVSSPVGLQFSADGQRLFAASAETRSVSVFDVASRTVVGRVELDCAPTEVRAFGERELWLLNPHARGQEPLYVISGAGQPAAWFVPREEPQLRREPGGRRK